MQASDYYPLMPRRMLQGLLIKAIQKNDVQAVEELIESGADPTYKNDPLYYALTLDHFNIAEKILEYYPDINKIYFDRRSLLTYFVGLYTNIPAVKFLLEHKANPNKRDKNGDYPINCTIIYDIIKLLLKYGADPNKKDHHGYTILMTCARRLEFYKDVIDTIKMLLKAGADPFIRKSHKYTSFNLDKTGILKKIFQEMNIQSIKPLLKSEIPDSLIVELRKTLGFGGSSKKSKKSKNKLKCS